MDVSLVSTALLNVLWWLVPVALATVFFRSPWFKGVLGETAVNLAAKMRLPRDTYHAIHNVTLMTPDGTTQIDHIFVSPYGIFVVETKNMKGWIFGGGFQAEWTQKTFKKTLKFQNPLRQNFKHMKALEEALDIPSTAIHSVIVFAGESVFKTPMPANVLRGGSYASYIKSFQHRVLLESEVREAIGRIESGRLDPSFKKLIVNTSSSFNHENQMKRKSAVTSAVGPWCSGHRREVHAVRFGVAPLIPDAKQYRKSSHDRMASGRSMNTGWGCTCNMR